MRGPTKKKKHERLQHVDSVEDSLTLRERRVARPTMYLSGKRSGLLPMPSRLKRGRKRKRERRGKN